jgi:hypothetical protein
MTGAAETEPGGEDPSVKMPSPISSRMVLNTATLREDLRRR